jgi:LPS-assembly lipoprotein
MSLPKARSPKRTSDGGASFTRRSFVRGLLTTAAVAPLVAACGDSGFRPLYAPASIGANAGEKLAQVKIAPIPGRVGQRIRNELIFQSTGGGNPLPPAYRLDVAIRESVTSTLVQKDGDSRGQIYTLDASFQLVRMETGEVLIKGISYGRAGFERFDSIFANVRAKQDAEDRAARTVGDDLRSRLSAYLASQA